LSAWWKRHGLRVVVHLAALTPLAALVWDYVTGGFLADPARQTITRTGDAALILLLASLACSLVALFLRQPQLKLLRRPLGLYAFGYATLHLLAFAGWDYGFNWRLLWPAIASQRFVLVGSAAWAILLALAVTSTRGAQRRLGRRWQGLHRAVYGAAALVILHFALAVKTPRAPILYGVALVVLLLARLPLVRRAIARKHSASL